MVRVGGLVVTKVTALMEGATEAEDGEAMTVEATTGVAMTVAEEVDLLVWGKLHSATAPKVLLYSVKYETTCY